MTVNTNSVISISEASQNFSKAAKTAETKGHTVILKNNKPKFLLIDVERSGYFEVTDDEKIDIAAKRVMNRFKTAFKELAE